jgi:hypothetical protein
MSKHLASDEARAITSMELHGLQGWLNAPLTGRQVISDQVHIFFASRQIEQFEIHPKKMHLTPRRSLRMARPLAPTRIGISGHNLRRVT